MNTRRKWETKAPRKRVSPAQSALRAAVGRAGGGRRRTGRWNRDGELTAPKDEQVRTELQAERLPETDDRIHTLSRRARDSNRGQTPAWRTSCAESCPAGPSSQPAREARQPQARLEPERPPEPSPLSGGFLRLGTKPPWQPTHAGPVRPRPQKGPATGRRGPGVPDAQLRRQR